MQNHMEENRLSRGCFQVSAGSIPGRRHVGCGNLLIGKNNQDALGVHRTESFLLASVHDGCSSGQFSEVGALMAPKLLAAAVHKALVQLGENPLDPQILIELTNSHFLDALFHIVDKLSPQETFDETLLKYFLFTTVAALIVQDTCLIFACGDGYVWVNDSLTCLAPHFGNTPSYIAYSLLANRNNLTEAARASSFSAVSMTPLAELDSLILATDGASPLIPDNDKQIPGKVTLVGKITDLPKEDRHFNDNNLEQLTLWLRQLNSEVTRLGTTESGPLLKRHYGLLEDDTTLICIRRRREHVDQNLA